MSHNSKKFLSHKPAGVSKFNHPGRPDLDAYICTCGRIRNYPLRPGQVCTCVPTRFEATSGAPTSPSYSPTSPSYAPLSPGYMSTISETPLGVGAETTEQRIERLRAEATELCTRIESKVARLALVGASDGMLPVVLLHIRVYENGGKVVSSDTYKIRPRHINEERAFILVSGLVKYHNQLPTREQASAITPLCYAVNEPLEGNEFAVECLTVNFGTFN